LRLAAALVAGLFHFAVPVVAASSVGGETGSVHPDGGMPQQGRVSCPDDLQVLVERPYAARAGIEAGSTIRLRSAPDAEPCPALVAGLFEPQADPSKLMGTRPRVLFHLPHLQALAGREGEVDYFTVQLRPGVDAATAARDMEPLLVGTQVWRAADVAPARPGPTGRAPMQRRRGARRRTPGPRP